MISCIISINWGLAVVFSEYHHQKQPDRYDDKIQFLSIFILALMRKDTKNNLFYTIYFIRFKIITEMKSLVF